MEYTPLPFPLAPYQFPSTTSSPCRLRGGSPNFPTHGGGTRLAHAPGCLLNYLKPPPTSSSSTNKPLHSSLVLFDRRKCLYSTSLLVAVDLPPPFPLATTFFQKTHPRLDSNSRLPLANVFMTNARPSHKAHLALNTMVLTHI